MTFGQKVALERKKKNWTQTQLAEATGSTRDLIGRYERDDVKPSIEVAANMADALKCSLDYLVRDVIPSDPNSSLIPEQLIPLLTELERLSPEDTVHVLAVINAFIVKAKIQSVIE
jgi:transcriptional regulator with XRE-family HTH domain